MRQVHMTDELAQQEFAKRAAAQFAANPRMTSFTDAEITPGALLAMRWGLMDDCVLVLKLDENHVPTNYAELVRQVEPPAPASAPTTSQPAADDDFPF